MDAQLDLLPAADAPSAPGPDGPRLGELLGALSHAPDMTEGQPAGHCLRSCWIGQQLGRAIGLNAAEMRDLFYATLLKDSGCSSNAARLCQLFLTDDLSFKRDRKTVGMSLPSLMRFVVRHAGAQAGLAARVRAIANAVQNAGEIHREVTDARCSRGAQIARQLRFSDDVADAIQALDEHWDGSGQPQGLAGKEIPLYSRIALLAQVVDVFHASAGPQATREEVARRSGRWFEPRLADAFGVLARDPAFWRQIAADDLEQQVLDMEPARQPQPVDDDTLDDIAAAFGQIVDAKSPWRPATAPAWPWSPSTWPSGWAWARPSVAGCAAARCCTTWASGASATASCTRPVRSTPPNGPRCASTRPTPNRSWAASARSARSRASPARTTRSWTAPATRVASTPGTSASRRASSPSPTSSTRSAPTVPTARRCPSARRCASCARAWAPASTETAWTRWGSSARSGHRESRLKVSGISCVPAGNA